MCGFIFFFFFLTISTKSVNGKEGHVFLVILEEKFQVVLCVLYLWPNSTFRARIGMLLLDIFLRTLSVEYQRHPLA